jgi:cation diffusion facilitator CzcD-associated flavoprotein CzcO
MSQLTHLDEIRDRYAIERARRLRAEGSAQYRAVERQEDPWAPPVERSALHDEVDVVVVGAGLSGLTCAALLRKAGVERVRLIDRAGDVGGIWYWNRYPAAQCDVESYIYLPLLEEMGYIPTQKYVYQPEILEYLQSVAKKHDLYEYGLFQTDVVEMAWNEADDRWTVLTDRGDAIHTQFLVVAGGFLERPKLPSLPGLGEFRGKVFHSSLWDYEYTGGGPGRDGGGLPNLHNKRVGLVGTGASGLQIATPVANAAQHLYVFQRTPIVVLPRGNRPTEPEWVEGLKPGWHRERVEAFNRRGNAILEEPDPIRDGWTEIVFPVMAKHGAGLFGDEEARKEAELFDLQTMDAVRKRVSELVHDPDTAAKLMPYFRMLCKRPSFHDEYLQTFNRPNVTLVDTEGAGLEKITANGVVARGETYEVDCLILATGFDTARGLLKSWGVDLVGRDGIRLSEYWKTGMRTFHGVFVRNFPNLFLHSTTQNAGPPNYSSSSVEISEYIVDVIARLKARGVQAVETTPEAEEEWVQTIRASVPDTHLEFFRNCTPGYYNNDGDLDDVNRLGANNFLAGSVHFYTIIRSWREQDDMPGLQLR